MSNKDYQNGFIAGAVSGGVVEIIDTTEIDNLEEIIDNSGVLENTEGSVSEKVEQLIEKVNRYNWLKDNTRTVGFSGNKDIITLSLDCINITDLYWFCYQMPNLESVYIKNTQNIQQWTYSFYRCPKLKTIETLNFSSCVASLGWNHMRYIEAVENLKVVPETLKASANFSFSSVLTAESIQSIAYGLAYVTTAQTLTLNKVFENDFEKLPAELRDLITNQKGWTLAFAS
jgi:hypothetical protein